MLPSNGSRANGYAMAQRRTVLPKSLQFVQTFGQLNVRSPRIGDVGHRDAQFGSLGKGEIELHSAGFRFLAKCLEVRDFKSDVVQHASLGRHSWSIGFCKRQVYSRHVGSLKLASFSGLGAESLDVPGLDFCHGSVSSGIRNIEMYVMKRDGHSERLILQNLDSRQII